MSNRSCLLYLALLLGLLVLTVAGMVSLIRGLTRTWESESGWIGPVLKEFGPGLDSLEAEMGKGVWEEFRQQFPEIRDKSATTTLDRLCARLCLANGIDTGTIRRHLLLSSQVNAMALPGKRLVVYSGLVREARHPDEVAGVLAHELAHITEGHVRQKVFKEAGLQMILWWIFGDAGGGLHQVAGMLGSSAFDRHLESRADRLAVQYLHQARINPEGLATFMDRLAASETQGPTPTTWFSTHPASAQRARTIRSLARSHLPPSTQQGSTLPANPYSSSLQPEEWTSFQKNLRKKSKSTPD